MKRLWNPVAIACCVMLILAACSVTIRQKKGYYSNKQTKEQWTEIKDTTGSYVRHGAYLSWYESGRQRTAGEYRHGRETGLWTTKYESGLLMEWHEYQDGDLHGLSVSYYPNRYKKHEGRYVRGEREGQWRSWHENGMLKEEGTYHNGERHGAWITWLPTGQKKQESDFKNDLLDGRHTTWRESGLRWVEGLYNNGEKDGLWTTWDEMGLVALKERYEAGKLVATAEP